MLKAHSKFWLMLVLLAFHVRAADVRSVWNGTSGSWTNLTNWVHSPAHPDADFPDNDTITYEAEITGGDIVIPFPLSPTVLAPTLDRLIFNGGNIYHRLPFVIRDTLWWTNGLFSGDGLILVSNGIVIAGDGPKSAPGGALLKSYGPTFLRGTNMGWHRLENYSDLYVETNGSFRGSLTVEGVVRKTAGTGVALFEDFVEFKRGVEVSSGSIEFGDAANVSGNIHLEPGTLLVQRYGSFGILSPEVVVSGRGILRFTEEPALSYVYPNVLCSADLEVISRSLRFQGMWTMQSNAIARIEGSSVSGSGGFVVMPGATFEVTPFGFTTLNLRITNEGTIRLLGNGQVNGHGKLVNHSLIELSDGLSWTDGSYENYLENRGVIRKSFGANTTALEGAAINNHGLVEVNSGTLSWRGGRHSGRFVANEGAAFVFDWNLNSPTICGEGTIFSGSGTNRIDSAFVSMTGNVTNLNRFELRSGGLNRNPALPAGVFHNAPSAVLTVNGFGTRITCLVSNFGLLDFGNSYPTIDGTGAIENLGTTTVEGGELRGGTFNNRGFLQKKTGSVWVAAPGAWSGGFNNFGTMEIEEGTMRLWLSGNHSGNFSTASNAFLIFDQVSSPTSHRLNHGALLAGSGPVQIGGSTSVEGNVTNTAPLTLTSTLMLQETGRLSVCDGGTLTWPSGTITGPGRLNIAPSGELRVAPGVHTWTGGIVDNHGLTTFTGGETTGHDSVLNNFGTTLANSFRIRWDNTGAKPLLNNVGSLVVTGGVFELPGQLTNGGTISILSGSLSVAQFINAGTTLATGAINAAWVENRSGLLQIAGSIGSNLSNNATMELGFNIANVSVAGQLRLSPESVIHLDLGGTNVGIDYDRLTVGGQAWLNGTLNIRLVNGFVPALGQQFRVLTHDYDKRGHFARVRGLNLGNGLRLMMVEGSRELDLLVVPATPSGPAPMQIQKSGGSRFRLTWPTGYEGFYFQTTTNLATAPWETFWIERNNFVDWPPPTIWPETEPRYNQSPRFFRLLDPDSP